MTYSDDELAATVRAAVKAQGCMCKLDVVIDHPDPDEPNYVHAEAHHDNWCPLALAANRSSN